MIKKFICFLMQSLTKWRDKSQNDNLKLKVKQFSIIKLSKFNILMFLKLKIKNLLKIDN